MATDVYAVEAVDPFGLEMGTPAERAGRVVLGEHVSAVLAHVQNAVITDDGIATRHQVGCVFGGSAAGGAVHVLIVRDRAWRGMFVLGWNDLAEELGLRLLFERREH